MTRSPPLRAVFWSTLTVALLILAGLLGPGAGSRATALDRDSSPSSSARASPEATPAAACSLGLQSTDPIVIDQAEIPDTLDPGVSFSVPGWGAIQQVYQGLVNYNGSSTTDFSGVLAQSWTVSTSPLTGFDSYTFTLRTGVHFSNGDPYNAYVQWYSLYRSLLLAQGPQFILEQNFYSTNFSVTSPLSYYSGMAADVSANTTLANDLNTWNFFDPTSSEIALMADPYQSFEVVGPSQIQLNPEYGYLASNYTYLLATLASPISYAVDPAFIDAHGGVVVSDVTTDYLVSHTLGTGPFTLQNFDPITGGGYSLVPDPNYWGGTAAAAEPWNNNLQPANATFQIKFQSTANAEVNDLITGAAASASFASTDATIVSDLEGNPCISVQALPTVYGATMGSWWVYLNQSVFPFNNLSVREAIAHSINFTQIISQAFGGWASQWVGPVPPGYPYYNPSGLSPYPYNLSLAQQEIANSPCASNACKGLSFNYEYLDTGAAWAGMADYWVSDLAAIGLTATAVPISLPDLYVEQAFAGGQCISATTSNGGPYYMGQEFYTSDYIAPDDWTQNDAYSSGSANRCMAGYSNATVDSLVFQAAAEPSPSQLTSDYTAITQAMYDNYTDIWSVVPTAFAFSSVFLHGVVQNPMASAEPWAMLLNTQWAHNPTNVTNPLGRHAVTFTETGLPSDTNWSVTVNDTEHSATTSSILFNESNGRYSFTVGSVAGYSATPLSGEVTVNGVNTTQAIVFNSTSTGGGGFLGLSGAQGYLLLGFLVAAVAVVVAVVVYRASRGRKKASPAPPPPGSS